MAFSAQYDTERGERQRGKLPTVILKRTIKGTIILKIYRELLNIIGYDEKATATVMNASGDSRSNVSQPS